MITSGKIDAVGAHRDRGRRGGWRDFGPAAALLLIGMAGLALAILAPSGRGGQYAVVAPPWYSQGRTIALIQQAGGSIAGRGGLRNIIIVHSENPAFARALYRAGAWLVIDPMSLQGCAGSKADPREVRA